MEEEGPELQEDRDSHSACTCEDPLGPSSVLADTEDAENHKGQCVPPRSMAQY